MTTTQRDRLRECIHRLQRVAEEGSSAGAAICDTLDFLIELAGDSESTDRIVPAYADLYEHSPDMLCSVDPQTGKIVRCNSTFADTLGFTKAEVVGHAVVDLYHADCQEQARRMFREFIACGEIRNEQLQVCRRDGSVIDVLLNATAVRDVRGQILYSRSSWRDITDLKQAERKLAASERRLRAILDTEPECVKLVDAEGTLLEMNPAGLSMIAADSAEQVVGHNLLPLVLPEHREAFKNLIRRVFDGETGSLAFEFRGLRGSHRWAETHASPLRNADGTISAMLSVTRDISEQKRAEAAIGEIAERLQLFIAHAPAALAMFDREMRYLAVSRRWMDDYLLGDTDIVGRSHYEVLPTIPQRWKEVHHRGLGGEVVRADEDRFVRPDGGVQWLRWEVRPWRAGDGSVGGIVIFTEDISNVKQAEASLRESQARQQLLIRASNIGLWDLNLITNEVFFSPEWKSQLGYADDELPNRYEEWESRLHPDDRMATLETINNFRLGQRPDHEVEFRLRHRDGSWRWILARAVMQYESDGQPTRMMGCHIDITERKLDESALQESEARLRLAMDAAEMGSWDWDLRTGEIIWSKEHERLWGMPPGSFRGTFEEFEARVHPEDRTGLAAAVTQARESQSLLAHEFRVVWPDGSIHWVAGEGRFDYDYSGQPIRMTGVVRNITEQRLAEGRATAFGKILEGSCNEIYILDDQTLRFLQVNRGARQNTGYTADELSRMTPVDLEPEFTVQIFEELTRPLRNGETHLLRFTASHRRKNGTSYPVEVHLQPVTFEGRPAFVAIVLDITDRLRAEQEIRQLNLELEQRVAERTRELQLANDDLDAYAHSVAHDLRAPLRAIFSFAKALREDYAARLDEHGREYTEFIESAAQQMDELICDVLEYSKIGRTKASLGAVDLDTIAARSLQPLDASIRQRQAVVDVAGPLGTVVGHEGMLVQAVTNLVSNATKFVEQGSVPRVQIRSEARNGSVRLWVEDNGIGISPENFDRIFRVFERLHGVESFPGTGIGLAIVRRAIETIGGLCGVESEIGRGSRFWIELPRHGSEA